MGFQVQNQPTYNSPGTLSGSQGGEPIILDDATVPGKVIHANPADSGRVDVLQAMRVRNENAITKPGWWIVQGGTLPVPASRTEMYQGFVPGAGEIKQPRDEPFPPVVVLAPGYTLHVSADVLGKPLTLSGAVDSYATGGVFGYGGLVQRAPVAVPDITAGNWATLQFDDGAVTNPIQVVQDTGNNRVQLNATGVWFATLYGVISVTKGNQDRVIYVRVFNETKNAPYSPNPWPLFIDNGQNGGAWSFSLLVEITDSLAGDFLRIELGGSTDAFAGITLQKQGANFVLIDSQAFGV